MDAAQPTRSRGFYVIRIAGILALMVAAFAGYARFNSSQRALSDNLAVLGVRLQSHEDTIALQEKRLAALEEKMAKAAAAAETARTEAPPPATASAPADAQELAKLEKDIAALKASSPAGAPADSERTLQAIRLLSSYHRLADKVIAGKPFAGELDTFEELTDKDDAMEKQLAIIAPFGSSGVPTYAHLLVSFDESLDQLNVFESTPPAGAGLWERFVYNIRHLVNIRRTGADQGGNSVEAIIGRASAHLDKEEIEAAIAEIKSLPDAPRSNFTSWLEEAQMATQAPGVIDNLEEAVMQKAFQPTPGEQAGK